MADVDSEPFERLVRSLNDDLKAALAENARLRQQLEAVTKERDAYRKSMIRYDRDWDTMVAERDAMRPVVEAAEAHRFHVFNEPVERICSEEEAGLFDAVDAWRAAQPDPKGPSGGLSASVGQDPGPVDPLSGRPALQRLAAQDEARRAARCPECGPGYHYGDEGCRHAPPRYELLGHNLPPATPTSFDPHTGELSWAQNVRSEPPADPAGLDAAIEAAARDRLAAWDYAHMDPESYEALVRQYCADPNERERIRAAAPHIRRAVLLEAAADVKANMQMPLWLEKWLRERAERETT